MLTKKDIDEYARMCRNWGRWGESDELGTLNFVTPEIILEAKNEIKTGQVLSLALSMGPSGPQKGGLGRFNPIHLMIATGSDAAAGLQSQMHISYADDVIIMPLQSSTQWDALSHVFYDNKMYNGYPMELVGSRGTTKNSIEKTKDKLVGRGVLLDVAKWKKKRYLEAGEAIHSEDLDKVAEWEGVTIRTGDFVLIRTGWMAKCMQEGWGDFAGGPSPGLAVDTCKWLYDKRVAAVASDTWGVEVIPNETKDIFQPWHQIVIPNMGLTVGEIFYLEELSEACEKDGRYTFFFCAPSLPFEGAVGSPVNPLAIR